MEKVKEDLKRTYSSYLKEGLPQEEALSKTLKEVRKRHQKEEFEEALEEFLRELFDSYKPENLTEADPLLSFVESLYGEYEFLKPKLEEFLKKLRGES
ncbi:hypothetical protein [Thermovibrio sp.]